MAMSSEIQQDIMSHFAGRDPKAGSAFDATGFWRITIPKYHLSDAELEGAMDALVEDGYVEAQGASYYLTSKGAARCCTTS